MPRARKKRQPPSKVTVVGQARNNALILFGTDKKESLEQRLWMGNVLSKSDQPVMQAIARRALWSDGGVADDSKLSFATICEREGVNAYMVANEVCKLMKAEGFILQAAEIPRLMQQTAQDALNKEEECFDCEGKGFVIEGEEHHKRCKPCRGTGKVTIEGSVEKLKLIFETHGLTGKGGGVNVNLDLRQQPGKSEALHELAGSLSGIIEGQVK